MVTGAENSSTVLERKEKRRSLPTGAGGNKWIILPLRGPKFTGAGVVTGAEGNTDRVQRLEAPEAIKDNLITGNGGSHVLTPPRSDREST